MNVGEQIAKQRKKLKMSTQQLADACGVSDQAVRLWGSNQRMPGKRTAPAIEEALKFQIDWNEGRGSPRATVGASTFNQQDMELVFDIARLPYQHRQAISHLVKLLLAPAIALKSAPSGVSADLFHDQADDESPPQRARHIRKVT